MDNGQKRTEGLIEVYVSQVYIYYTCGIFLLRVIKISDYEGKEVEVNGKTYKICGLIENNLTGDMSDTIINVFIRRMRTDETSFSMLINTGSLSYKSKMNRMIEKYNIKEHFENRAAIRQAEISNQGRLKNTNGFLVIMLLCVLILILFITYIMMRFYYMGLQKQMAIYEKIGISKKQRNTGYVVSVIIILTVSGLIGFTGSAGVLSFLMQSYDASGNMGLCLTGVVMCGLLFIILNIVSAVIVTKRADQTKKKKTLENTSSRLDGDVNIYISGKKEPEYEPLEVYRNVSDGDFKQYNLCNHDLFYEID